MFELLEASVDNSDPSTITVPNTDTTLKTFNVPENKYTYVLLSASVLVDQTATAAVQTVNIKVKDGTTVVKTYPFKTSASAKYDVVTFSFPVRKTTSGAIVLTVSGGSADANTSVGMKSYWLAGIN